MRKRLAALLIAMVCSLFALGSALATNGVVIQRSVVGAWGEQVTDGSLFILNGTLGEPVASAIVLETNVGLGSGFWWPRGSKVFLPLVLSDY